MEACTGLLGLGDKQQPLRAKGKLYCINYTQMGELDVKFGMLT